MTTIIVKTSRQLTEAELEEIKNYIEGIFEVKAQITKEDVTPTFRICPDCYTPEECSIDKKCMQS